MDSVSPHGDDSSYDSYSYASYSGDSSDTEPPVSEGSDHHSMLEHAYSAARDVLHVRNSLNVMGIFPPHWPLAKMTLPLKFGVQRLDRLVAGYSLWS